ncbi:hypothetical protein LguiB_020811 [Lonicera macranthoides]
MFWLKFIFIFGTDLVTLIQFQVNPGFVVGLFSTLMIDGLVLAVSGVGSMKCPHSPFSFLSLLATQ